MVEEKKETEAQEKTKLELELKSITCELDFGDPKEAFKRLKALSLHPSNQYACVVEYLKGKYFFGRGKFEKALVYFQRAIQLFDDNRESHFTNVKAICLYDIGRIYYMRNEYEAALNFADQGLSAVVEPGERLTIKFALLLSKVIYLEKIDRNEEALRILDELWKYEKEIYPAVLINMYDMQAKLYGKMRMFDKAIFYAMEGINLAMREKNYNRCFELWTTLGSIYKDLGQYDLAKICFYTAFKLEHKVTMKDLRLYNYIQLGQHYLKEGNLEEARKALEEAVQLGKETNNATKLCEALISLADCYHSLKEYERFVDNLKMAFEIARKHSLLTKEQSISLKLSKYYEDKDKESHHYYLNHFYQASIQVLEGGGKND